MKSDYYSQDVYNRTIGSMLVEWDAHNRLNSIKSHERLKHTDFDKNDEGVGYWGFFWRAVREVISGGA